MVKLSKALPLNCFLIRTRDSQSFHRLIFFSSSRSSVVIKTALKYSIWHEKQELAFDIVLPESRFTCIHSFPVIVQGYVCNSRRVQAPHLAYQIKYSQLDDAWKVPAPAAPSPGSPTADFNLAGMLPILRKSTTKKKRFWSITASGATATTNGLTGQAPTLDLWRGFSPGEKAWTTTLCLWDEHIPLTDVTWRNLFFCVLYFWFFLQGFHVNDKVLASWSDCRFYPAKVIAVNKDGESCNKHLF